MPGMRAFEADEVLASHRSKLPRTRIAESARLPATPTFASLDVRAIPARRAAAGVFLQLTTFAMGHRLSKIVTRTGDAGTTGLGDGSRVAKDGARIEAIGTVDELNSSIGVVLAEGLPPTIQAVLTDIQHDLFDLGGELSIPGHAAITASHIERLEDAVEHYNADLPPLKEFILPGGTRPAALIHVARTVCRRAERVVVSLASHEQVSAWSRIYLNRLSDLLFVLARAVNRAGNSPDVLWRKDRARGEF